MILPVEKELDEYDACQKVVADVVVVEALTSKFLPDVAQVAEQYLVRTAVALEAFRMASKEVAGHEVDPMERTGRTQLKVGSPRVLEMLRRERFDEVFLDRPIGVRRLAATPNAQQLWFDGNDGGGVREIPGEPVQFAKRVGCHLGVELGNDRDGRFGRLAVRIGHQDAGAGVGRIGQASQGAADFFAY